MCGICGIAAPCLAEEDIAIVRRMTQALRHRGPDHQAVAARGGAVLGHARLSVIDLAPGAHQPMVSPCGRYAIVYNGELYNFMELRQELRRAGHEFATQGDTEVLLRLWQVQGRACLPRLAGMFAFALWDAEEKTLFLARDRFGQKPLFYAAPGPRLLFASTLGALLCDPRWERRADLNALYHYLTVQSVPAPLCAFQGVRKLPPAHCLAWTSGSAPRVEAYWQADAVPPFTGTLEEAVEEGHALLRQAVRRHMVSDVPLGFFLSGGVDSSLITALAAENAGETHSFSIGFAEAAFDERPFAREAARMCGTTHHELEVRPDVAALLPQLVRHYGEPFADSSAVPTWLLARMTRRHVTVALSGDGGDDLFGGYERYLNPYLYPDDARLPEDVARLRAAFLALLRQGGRTFRPADLPGWSARYYRQWACLWGALKVEVCAPELRRAARPPLSLHLMLEHFSRHAARPPLDRMQLFELDYYLATTLLPKVDVASMAHALEVRAPFLDNAVADLALSLPPSMRVEHDPATGTLVSKAFVKRIAVRYFSREFVHRPKMGFGIPLGAWLRGPLRELAHDVLLGRACRERGWIAHPVARRMLREHMAGETEHPYTLWALLLLELWGREMLDSAG